MTTTLDMPPLPSLPAFSVLEIQHLQPHAASHTDIIAFLQKQMTADMAPLSEGSPVFTAYANHQGRVVASGWWVPCPTGPDRLWWVVADDMRARLCDLLNRFGQFEKLRATPVDSWCCHAELVTTTDPHTISFPHWQANAHDATLQLSATLALTLEPGTDGATPPDGAWVDACLSVGCVVVGAALSERFTPSMLNYHAWNAVCLTKGCFLGQEVIARVHHLGQTKRSLHRANVQHNPPPTPGTPVERDGQKIGQLVYAGPSVMLAILPRPRGGATNDQVAATNVAGHTVDWQPVEHGATSAA